MGINKNELTAEQIKKAMECENAERTVLIRVGEN